MYAPALLIEPHYWGNIAYYQTILKAGDVVFDLHGHYRKGSFRNRTQIMGPNGLLNLSVPLQKGKFQHTPMGKVRVSYAENWRKDHWMSLVSSYRRSAYFEYYEDDIRPFYEEEFEFLFQMNVAALEIVRRLLKLELKVGFSEKYFPESSWAGTDFRDHILPNSEKCLWKDNLDRYPQVFMDRMNFLPNLSILDLLFNLGPGAKEYLMRSH
jgi:hypothetical protein